MGFIIFVVVGIVSLGLRAFTLMMLWSWFVVPYFSMSKLSFSTASGFILVMEVFMVSSYYFRDVKEARNTTYGDIIFVSSSRMIYTLFCLLVGLLIRLLLL